MGTAAPQTRCRCTPLRAGLSPQVFRYSLQKLAYTVSRTGRQVLGERRQRAPN